VDSESSYHEPVLVVPVVETLVTDLSGLYLDATAGGGGHSEAILQQLDQQGSVVALDKDEDAIAQLYRLRESYGDRLEILHGDFADAEQILAANRSQPRPLAGALFDLGVSSHQINAAARGFSYHQDGPLDMRMDCSSGVPAGQLLAQVSEADLVDLIRRYGEEWSARRIARSICRRRQATDGMVTTAQLRAAIAATGPKHLTKTLARVFQALRIAVNGELERLSDGLDGAISMLAPGGRLAVISYHSLEDRVVKGKLNELVKGCLCPPRLTVCVCGRQPEFKSLSRKSIRPDEAELERNNRSRSARLRVFEKMIRTANDPMEEGNR